MQVHVLALIPFAIGAEALVPIRPAISSHAEPLLAGASSIYLFLPEKSLYLSLLRIYPVPVRVRLNTRSILMSINSGIIQNTALPRLIADKNILRVPRGRPQLFFDTEQLVVFGNAIGARHGTRFDLAGIHGNRQIGDKAVFRLAGAV